ncbi:hypothetical protein [Azohydromonas aeria]|uniref:hypothetical protein n=1 Tax=Azohydromonas aeria TaxID=2590212 RepID=UPI0012F98C0B|nr:hypothetical protein [Azohydromonas aeria]
MATTFAETMIHESSAWSQGAWLVAEADLTGRWVVSFQPVTVAATKPRMAQKVKVAR